LPRSVLAGIVWNACIGMFPFEKMKELAKVDTKDFYIVMATLMCTTWWGIFEGIEVGFGLSVLLLLERTSRPHSALMGRIPHSSTYGDISSWPDAMTTNGVILFRVDGALYFGNCNFLKRAVQVLVERNRRQGKRIFYFILDCQSMNDLDSSGVLALDIVEKYLAQGQIVLILTGVKYPVMKLIKRSNLVELIGVDHFFNSVFDAHVNIYARIRLAQGLEINIDSPYDYVDEKGANLIHFGDFTIGQLERPFTEKERAKIAAWNPYKFNAIDHPLNKIKKGFELNRSIGRFSFAPKAERIAVEITGAVETTSLFEVRDEAVQVA
jgi:ABC-type transporter Mla MlaB component